VGRVKKLKPDGFWILVWKNVDLSVQDILVAHFIHAESRLYRSPLIELFHSPLCLDAFLID
jgi:hypothetical protein